MHIIFGQDLEGCPLPHTLHGINALILGPRGLIDFLELRLGLPPGESDETARLLAYRQALQVTNDAGNCFYRESFEVDPIGSAKVLLRWRDELRINGWAGDAPDQQVSPKLSDLAKVESAFLAQGCDETDEATRLQTISAALAAGTDPKLETFELIEDREHFPLRWQQVLDQLPVTPFALPLPTAPIAEPGTRLHAMQQRLLDGSKIEVTAADDPSIRIIESPVLSKNADAAASLLKALASRKIDRSALVGNPTDCQALDQSLFHLDGAAVGSTTRSSLGTLVQLAPVLLRLHWGPFHPQAWLEFFLHPVSPVSRKLSRALAYAINTAPSRENPAWNQAIDKVIGAADDKKEKKRLTTQTKEWLQPKEFNTEANAKVLADTMAALAEWLGKRGSRSETKDEAGIFLAASLSVRKLARTIESVDKVTREDLDRIVAEWLPNAASGESKPAQLGSATRLSTPGHLLETVDHVVWWQPQERTINRQPWNRAEFEWLAKNGVNFPDPNLLTQTNGNRSRSLVLNARKTLTVFYCPQTIGASSSTKSPMMVRLQAGFNEEITIAPDELIDFESVPVVPLPAQQTVWKVSNPDLLLPRETESFSSLSRYIYIPYDWLFNYKAKLRKGALVDYRIVDDARRQGSLLHGFVESLLEPEPDPLEIEEGNTPEGERAGDAAPTAATGLLDTLVRRLFSEDSAIDWQDIPQTAVNEWVEKHWNDILRNQAAHYLVPGNEASRSELLYLAKTALWELLQQLRAADVVSVICEEEISGVEFCGGKIDGFVDLRVTNGKGEFGVIDLKLSGLTNRREELARGRHLQLAIYGHLVRAKYGQNAYSAYFIFSSGGKMLARSNNFFPNAEVVGLYKNVVGGEWHACWKDFEYFWTQRNAEMQLGTVAVEPTMNLGYWEILEPSRYSNFKNLIGWSVTD